MEQLLPKLLRVNVKDNPLRGAENQAPSWKRVVRNNSEGIMAVSYTW